MAWWKKLLLSRLVHALSTLHLLPEGKSWNRSLTVPCLLFSKRRPICRWHGSTKETHNRRSLIKMMMLATPDEDGDRTKRVVKCRFIYLLIYLFVWSHNDRTRLDANNKAWPSENENGKKKNHKTIIEVVVVVDFSSLARIWGKCSTIHSQPAR